MNWQAILDFVVAHKPEILLAASVVATFTWEKSKAIAVSLMLQAEKEVKEELALAGPEKLEWVMYMLNRKYFRNLVPDSVIQFLAQKWYDEAMSK